jgi:hypothetical protein
MWGGCAVPGFLSQFCTHLSNEGRLHLETALQLCTDTPSLYHLIISVADLNQNKIEAHKNKKIKT